MRSIPLLLLGAALAGCTTAPAEQPTRSARAEAEFQQLIAGRAAGPAVSCLPSSIHRETVAIDDNTIAFRQGSTVYVSQLQGGCSGLGSGFYAMVTRTSGSGLCRGDIAEMADVSTGMTYGSCIIGDFVPYRRP